MDVKREAPRWREIRTGLLVLLLLVPLALGIFFLDSLRRAFAEGPELVLVAEEIRGLERGADVWVAGRPAGRVTEISFLSPGRESGSIGIRVVLRRDAASALRRDASARIGESALLAPAVVKLDPGSPGAPALDPRDTLVVESTLDVDDFRAFADSAGAAAGTLAEDLQRLEATVASGGGLLARLRRDPALLDRLDTQRRRAERVRESWRHGGGLGTAWRDRDLRARAAGIGDRVRRLAPGAEREDDGVTVDPARTIEALRAARSRLSALSGRLDAAEGTLGRMATDDELRRQIERTRSLLDSLAVDAASRPLRYLRLRLF